VTDLTPEQKAKLDAACDDIERLLDQGLADLRTGQPPVVILRRLQQALNIADSLKEKP
jgi:hypothetical protein